MQVDLINTLSQYVYIDNRCIQVNYNTKRLLYNLGVKKIFLKNPKKKGTKVVHLKRSFQQYHTTVEHDAQLCNKGLKQVFGKIPKKIYYI